jgi:hypothetical protein
MNKNLDNLRRKVYLSYHQDGILDLVAATVLLGFSAFMATKNVIFLVLGMLFSAQYILMKQSITIPRLGFVRFDSEKKSMLQGWLFVGIGVLVMFLFYSAQTYSRSNPAPPNIQEMLQRYHMVPLSAMLFGLPTLAAAIFFGLKRFYLYALLAVGLPALGAWLEIETFIPIMSIGLLMLGIGLWLLGTFIRKYPLNQKEGSDGGE